uniref:Uncharacterized protein n=1 Tax=Nymphaea colorata TaxID=210225 RepID=A0A5K0Z1R3_9MAGN
MSVDSSSISPNHPRSPHEATAVHSPDGDTAGLKSATDSGVNLLLSRVSKCIEYTAAQLCLKALAGVSVDT